MSKLEPMKDKPKMDHGIAQLRDLGVFANCRSHKDHPLNPVRLSKEGKQIRINGKAVAKILKAPFTEVDINLLNRIFTSQDMDNLIMQLKATT